MAGEGRMLPFFTDRKLNTNGNSQYQERGGTSRFCNRYRSSAGFLTLCVWPASHPAAPEDFPQSIFTVSTWQPRCLFMLGDCLKKKLPRDQVVHHLSYPVDFFPKMSHPQLFCLQHLPNIFCDSCPVSTWPTPSTLVILVTIQLTWLPWVFYSRNEARSSSLLTPHSLWEVSLRTHFFSASLKPRRVTVNCCRLLRYLEFSLSLIYSSHCKEKSPLKIWTKTTVLHDAVLHF